MKNVDILNKKKEKLQTYLFIDSKALDSNNGGESVNKGWWCVIIINLYIFM